MLKLPWSRKNDMQPQGVNFVILPMWHAHLKDVCRIESATFGEPWPEAAFSHCICSNEHAAFVATIDNQVVGYVVMHWSQQSHQVVNIAVDEPFRRIGVGRCLIMQQLALLGGANQMLAAVSDKNLAAHQFFRSLAFCAISIGSRFFANGDDAFVFQWRVGAKDRYHELKDINFVLPESHKFGVPVAR